jgi:hypothetical protein
VAIAACFVVVSVVGLWCFVFCHFYPNGPFGQRNIYAHVGLFFASLFIRMGLLAWYRSICGFWPKSWSTRLAHFTVTCTKMEMADTP